MTRDTVQVYLHTTSPQARYDAFFLERGLGLNPSAYRRTHLPRIAALDALSDLELAILGLTRDRIVPYVFRRVLSG